MTEEMLEDILNAIKALDRLMEERFNEMNTKFDKMFAKMEARFDDMERKFEKRFVDMERKFDKMLADMDHRFDRLEKKVDGFRVDLTDTQEVTDFLLSRTAKHEKKIHNLTSPQN